MSRIILLSLTAVMMLSGCVTETTIIGKNSVKQQNEIDVPAATKSRIELGMGYLNQGEMAAAKYNFEKALDLSPGSVDASLAMAYYYQRVGDKSLAKNTYEKLLSSHSNNPDVLNNYGTFLCRNYEYDKADELFMKAVVQPKYLRMDDTYENAGVCASAAKNYVKAKEYYRLALGYNPNKLRLYLDLADISLKNNTPSEAESWLSQFRKKTDDTAESLWLSILAAQAQGRLAEMHVYGQSLVQRFPSSAQAKRYQNNDY